MLADKEMQNPFNEREISQQHSNLIYNLPDKTHDILFVLKYTISAIENDLKVQRKWCSDRNGEVGERTYTDLKVLKLSPVASVCSADR